MHTDFMTDKQRARLLRNTEWVAEARKVWEENPRQSAKGIARYIAARDNESVGKVLAVITPYSPRRAGEGGAL